MFKTIEVVGTQHLRGGFKVIEVDTRKSTYKGIPLASLGSFGRRRFENLVIMENARERVKLLYV